jgi:conjugal transfer ATP-binding protein TraC
MARLFSGQFIEFGPKAGICLNPFSKLTKMDEEELQLLTPLIAQMASPSRPMSDWEKNILEKIIQRVFGQMENRSSIDAIAKALEDHPDQRARDIGVQLFSYTSRGRRGRYFSGENNVDLANPLVVLELEELKSDPELQLAVLQVYLYNINQSVYLSDRKNKTLVIVDEGWQLFDGVSTGQFFERSYRQFRKYNAAAMTISQAINDFYKNPATRACMENSDWTFLLRQKPESIAALKESKRLIVPEHEFETLSTIHTITGQYSEVYVVGPRGRFIGRLYIDPFSYWIYTTNAQDNALLFTFFDAYNGNREVAIQSCVESNGLYRQLLKEGKTTDEAIGVCMNRYFRKDQAIRETGAAHA